MFPIHELCQILFLLFSQPKKFFGFIVFCERQWRVIDGILSAILSTIYTKRFDYEYFVSVCLCMYLHMSKVLSTWCNKCLRTFISYIYLDGTILFFVENKKVFKWRTKKLMEAFLYFKTKTFPIKYMFDILTRKLAFAC